MIFLGICSACDRNVELAQLIQQKLDAYKAGKTVWFGGSRL